MTAPNYNTREARLKLLRMSYQHVMAQGRKSVRPFDSEGRDNVCVYRAPNGDGCAAAPFIGEYVPAMDPAPFREIARKFPNKLEPAAVANAEFVGYLQQAHDRATPVPEKFLTDYQRTLGLMLEAWHRDTGEKFTLTDAASHSVNTLLRAVAVYIEEQPEKYNFMITGIPKEGEPGCMLGLLGGMAQVREYDELGMKSSCSDVSRWILGICHGVFYDRIGHENCHDPKLAAKALRLYADKYHPEPF